MTYRPKLQLHPPAHWQDFENLCWGLWKEIWGDPNTQKNGRQGGAQHGVDVFGQPDTGVGWAGVQCKGKENFTRQTLTKGDVAEEVRRAKGFSPALAEFTIATTAPRDGELQGHVRRLGDRLKRQRLFRLCVCGWDDIENLIYEHEPPIARRFYPDVFGGQTAGFTKHLLRLLASLPLPPPDGPPDVSYRTAGGGPAEDATEVHLRESTGEDIKAVAPFESAEDGIRAVDVGLALQRLSRLEAEFAQHADATGTTSADAKLARAVKRVARGTRDD